MVLLLPRAQRRLTKWVGLVASMAVLVVVAVLVAGFDTAGKQYQLVESHPWIPAFGSSYTVGVDGIALVLVVLTAVLVPLLIVASWNEADDQRFGGQI